MAAAAAVFEFLNSGVGVIGLLLVVLSACGLTYVLTRRSILVEVDELRSELAEISGLRNAVEELATLKLETRTPAKASVVQMPKPAPKPEQVKAAQPSAKPDEIAHETLVVIAAAVAAFLGKSVRLRSARLVQPVAESAWAQQGRVYVQASHNLARA